MGLYARHRPEKEQSGVFLPSPLPFYSTDRRRAREMVRRWERKCIPIIGERETDMK